MTYEELPEPIEIGNAENLIGQTFGELTVLYRVPTPPHDYKPFWACHCSCGNYNVVRGDRMKTGRCKTCGAREHENLVGSKYGQLVVAERLSEFDTHKSWKYKCFCTCGNTTPVYTWGYSLKNGHRTRCDSCASNMIDLTGQTFGMLTVLKKSADQTIKHGVNWDCVCRCGNTKTVCSSSLLGGTMLSCGKHHMSNGEIAITQILDEAKVRYIHNKEFAACKFPDTNRAGLFDFYFKDDKFLVEFDGNQHFGKGGASWNSETNFVKTHNRDLYKNKWAWDNNIPMKRIPYSSLKKLSYDKLFSDEYLITPTTHPWWYPPEGATYPYFTVQDIDEIENTKERGISTWRI